MVSYSGVTRKSLTKADEHFRNDSLTLVSPKFRVHGQFPCAIPIYTSDMSGGEMRAQPFELNDSLKVH